MKKKLFFFFSLASSLSLTPDIPSFSYCSTRRSPPSDDGDASQYHPGEAPAPADPPQPRISATHRRDRANSCFSRAICLRRQPPIWHSVTPVDLLQLSFAPRSSLVAWLVPGRVWTAPVEEHELELFPSCSSTIFQLWFHSKPPEFLTLSSLWAKTSFKSTWIATDLYEQFSSAYLKIPISAPGSFIKNCGYY